MTRNTTDPATGGLKGWTIRERRCDRFEFVSPDGENVEITGISAASAGLSDLLLAVSDELRRPHPGVRKRILVLDATEWSGTLFRGIEAARGGYCNLYTVTGLTMATAWADGGWQTYEPSGRIYGESQENGGIEEAMVAAKKSIPVDAWRGYMEWMNRP